MGRCGRRALPVGGPGDDADQRRRGRLLPSDLAAHRGDLDAANRELAESGPRADASDLVARRTWFHRARSLVSLLEGDLARAYEEAIGAVDMDPSGMNTPLASREAARAAVWSRDAEKVRRAVAAMSALPGRWIDA